MPVIMIRFIKKIKGSSITVVYRLLRNYKYSSEKKTGTANTSNSDYRAYCAVLWQMIKQVITITEKSTYRCEHIRL